jgi:hypothetical protein
MASYVIVTNLPVTSNNNKTQKHNAVTAKKFEIGLLLTLSKIQPYILRKELYEH